MTGGLLNPAKRCPHGHGPLERQPGIFALPGMALNPVAAKRAEIKYVRDERAFVVSVLLCQECGYVELEDVA